MIHTIRTVTVGDQESKIDSPIILYRGDREVEVEFTINGSKFTFTNGGNVIKSTNATHGQLVINTPTGENMFSEVTECHDGKVVFVITKEMIDELIEVGFYSFQIRLFDESQVSRVTIPPVLKGIDIRNPIAAEDETNVVDIGLVDYAVVVKDEFEDLSTFLPDGNYNKTEWESKDVISGAKLNKIEDALYNINSNMEATDFALLNRVENINKNVYREIDKLGNELESEVEEFERSLNTNVEQFKIDTNSAMAAHKNEVTKELESVNSQLDRNTNKQSKSVTDFIEYKKEKDDWEMLQACLNSVKQETGRYSGYVYTGWSEKIIFPTGDYKISKPLVCNLFYPNIDFQGSRIMPTSDFEGDFAIEFTNIWNGKFSNLVLDGFDKHIKMYNDNLDSGNIKIDDVSMYGGSVGYDIECQSSKTTITNFKFNNVRQPAIIRRADKMTFRSGWMDAGVLTEEYQGMFEIDNCAQVIIEDMIYVPRPQSVNKVYVVKLINGEIKLDNCLFGGEPGQIPIVGVFGGYLAGRGNCVNIINTKIYMTKLDSGIVELYDIPNKIVFDNFYGLTEPVGNCRFICYRDDFKPFNEVLTSLSNSAGPIIFFNNIDAPELLGSTQYDILADLLMVDGKKNGLVKCNNTQLAEIKFGVVGNNVNYYSFRKYATYRCCIMNKSNGGADRYSEYIITASYDGADATIVPIIEGTSTASARLVKEGNIVKMKSNGSIQLESYMYTLEKVDMFVRV